MFKKALLFSLVLVFVFSFIAFSGTLSDIIAKGVIRVGNDATYAPFEYRNFKNEIVGFDIDLIKALAKEMGNFKVEIIDTAWDGIIPGLLSKKYDMICSAMTITKERAKKVTFSDPYFETGQVITVFKDRNDIKSVEDLKGKIIAVQLGTTGDFAVSKIEGAKVKRFDTIDKAYFEVMLGRADAVVNDLAQTAYGIKRFPLKIVGKPFTTEYYGIAMRKEDKDLHKAVNEALKRLKEKGIYDKIYKKWFGGK
jgi:polar amino acid transport system substrate-binding protein